MSDDPDKKTGKFAYNGRPYRFSEQDVRNAMIERSEHAIIAVERSIEATLDKFKSSAYFEDQDENYKQEKDWPTLKKLGVLDYFRDKEDVQKAVVAEHKLLSEMGPEKYLAFIETREKPNFDDKEAYYAHLFANDIKKDVQQILDYKELIHQMGDKSTTPKALTSNEIQVLYRKDPEDMALDRQMNVETAIQKTMWDMRDTRHSKHAPVKVDGMVSDREIEKLGLYQAFKIELEHKLPGLQVPPPIAGTKAGPSRGGVGGKE